MNNPIRRITYLHALTTLPQNILNFKALREIPTFCTRKRHIKYARQKLYPIELINRIYIKSPIIPKYRIDILFKNTCKII